MKLAKKVFATVMAVAMIFALSAIAFAAAPTVNLVAGDVKDGQVKVSVYFDDAIGLKSWDINVNYDATVLQFKSIAKYKDSENYLSSIVKLLGYTPSSSTDGTSSSPLFLPIPWHL